MFCLPKFVIKIKVALFFLYVALFWKSDLVAKTSNMAAYQRNSVSDRANVIALFVNEYPLWERIERIFVINWSS